MRERVARIVGRLPSEAEAPRILKQSAGFTTTMWLALSSSTWTDLELGDYADRYLVDQFSSIKNVGRIRTGGLRELSIRVWIDPIKLAANNLTIQEVERSLKNENIRLPAGTLEAENIDLTINIDKSYIMHLAVGTSYSIIIPPSLVSVLTHKKNKFVDNRIIKNYGLFVIIGGLLGTIFAALMQTKSLVLFFSVVVYFLGTYLLLNAIKVQKIKKNFEITSLITGKNFETVKKLILKKCI